MEVLLEDVAVAENHQALSLTDFVIGLCRKFKLFPSERTTIVTHNEEMQIFLYCSALHNKKECSKFDANPKICEKMHSEMMRRRIVKLEAKVRSIFLSQKTKADFSNLVEQPDESHLHNVEKDESKSKQQDSKGECLKNEMRNHNEETDPDTEKESWDFDASCSSVMSLFLESLKSSNHFTLLDVFEKFLDEVVNNESKLHTFVKQNFKTDVGLSKSSFLPKVEVLTVSVLKKIAGLDEHEEDVTMSSQTLKSSQEEADLNVNSPHNQSLNAMSLLSSPSTRVRDTPNKLRPFKTPVQVLKSKYRLSSPLLETPVTPSTDLERQQIQKKFIGNIFRCYLHLLVNTRCELALASVFNIPERELNHEAFTHLKHASATSGLSMYQTMSSILMRVRLGGHGYAPSSDSPLLLYIKGIGSLFDFVDKLQTVIEESVSPRTGCRRVVNVIKRNISMCKSRRFPSSVVDTVASALWDSLDDILSEMERGSKESKSDDAGSQECAVIGQESIDAIQKYLDQSSVDVSDIDRYLLGDVRFSQDTPTRFPSFMNQFRSPLLKLEEEQEDMDGHCTTTKSEAVKPSSTKVSEALYLDIDEADKIVSTPLDLDNVYVIPSKTIIHPKCGADYGEVTEGLFSPQKGKNNNRNDQKKREPNKRKKKKTDVKIGTEEVKNDGDENSPQPKSIKSGDGKSSKSVSVVNRVNGKGDGNKKQNKTCRRKLLPQIKGQSKLIGFFKA